MEPIEANELLTKMKAYDRHPELMPWECEEIYTCIYDGAKFRSLQALRAHLQFCPKRSLKRYFVCNKYVFCIYCNPTKKLIRAISKECIDSGDAKLVMGLLRGGVNTGDIKEYFATEIMGLEEKHKPFIMNGLITRTELKRKLSELNLKLLVEEEQKHKKSVEVKQNGK